MSKENSPAIVSNKSVNVKDSSLKKKNIELLEKANTLPKTAGCYLMKNKIGAIIYVGKAKNLKARVASYFNNSAKSAKTTILVGHIRSFDFILTQSEAESLVLENNLIKEHRPKYNIRLKDDKSYPYLAVNKTRDFPRLEYVRRPKRQKKVDLFGPYPVGSNISKIMRIAAKAFNIRDCNEREFNSRSTPCMLYQIKQCSAPCVDYISEADYAKDLESALNFFGSHKRFKKSLQILEAKMQTAAQDEAFELAAQIRDYIKELEEFGKKSFDQNVELLGDMDTDIIAYFVGEEEVDLSLYLVRGGNLLGHKNFHFLKADLFNEIEEDILGIILQYYIERQDIFPARIITNFSKIHNSDLEEALKTTGVSSDKLKVQSAGTKYESLLSTTVEHARESQRVRKNSSESVYVGLNRLKELLNLRERPKTLECYDIAIWQGKSPTAAQIVFYEGKPDKTKYRHYNLTELPEGNNDFAMMQEVFARRLKRGELPDVFIVDGGIGQVNAAKKVLVELAIETPIVGIAKARDLLSGNFKTSEIRNSDERLVIPGRSNPYILSKNPPLMKIVVGMRDEAHRFSRRLHHKKEEKRIITSWTDDIKGLSKKLKTDILRINTMSMEELKGLKVKELSDFFGLQIKHASLLYDHLHAKK